MMLGGSEGHTFALQRIPYFALAKEFGLANSNLCKRARAS